MTIQFVLVKVVVGVIYTVVSVSVEAIVFSIILVVRYTFDLSLWILVAKVTQYFRMIVSSLSYMQFFLRGFCKDGSACKFLHSRDNEAPMRQALSSNEKNFHPKVMEKENHKVDAHGQEYNLQVGRKRESIEWQTREAQEMGRRKSKAFLEEQRVTVKETETRDLILFFYCHCKVEKTTVPCFVIYTVDFHLIYLFSGQD